MALDILWWVVIAALVIYGIATFLASFKYVPERRVGVVSGPRGQMRVLGKGFHLVVPFTQRLKLVPTGPERMDAEVTQVVTRDGWRITAHIQLNARLVDHENADEAGDDWRRATLDTARRVLRTELENNDAVDLRPRPQALDEGVMEEINILTRRWGVEVDWVRVTIRWAYSIPPASQAPHY